MINEQNAILLLENSMAMSFSIDLDILIYNCTWNCNQMQKKAQKRITNWNFPVHY